MPNYLSDDRVGVLSSLCSVLCSCGMLRIPTVSLCNMSKLCTLIVSLYTSHITPQNRAYLITDFTCGALKINCAIDKLPNFTCYPSPPGGLAGPMHMGTVHFESSMAEIEVAYQDAARGRPARRPVVC